MNTTALEATALGKRFGRRRAWALRDCTFRVPAGSVCALVGPNGAGKSTLLGTAAGLLAPTEGAISVLGRLPGQVRPRVGYLAQDKPLYRQLTVAETLRMGAYLNPGCWDAATAESVIAGGALNSSARIRSLSGGQRTRVALALILAKRPELLLLDEPMADLDPLARHELMGALLGQAARFGTTVVMSSHVIAELEGACDHLVLFGAGQARLAGDIEDLLATHQRLSGPVQDSADGVPAGLTPADVVTSSVTGRQLTAVVQSSGPAPGGWRADPLTLEELILAHLRSGPTAPAFPFALATAGTQETQA